MKVINLIIIYTVMFMLYFISISNCEATYHTASNPGYEVQSICGFYPTLAKWIVEDKNKGMTKEELLSGVSNSMKISLANYIYGSSITDPQVHFHAVYEACKEYQNEKSNP